MNNIINRIGSTNHLVFISQRYPKVETPKNLQVFVFKILCPIRAESMCSLICIRNKKLMIALAIRQPAGCKVHPSRSWTQTRRRRRRLAGRQNYHSNYDDEEALFECQEKQIPPPSPIMGTSSLWVYRLTLTLNQAGSVGGLLAGMEG